MKIVCAYFCCLVETRRGDLEILAYNLIHWLGGTLPWESDLTDPKLVQQSKEQHMSNIKAFLKTCLQEPPSAIENLLKYINSLKFNDAPDYKKMHTILLAGLKEAGGAPGKPLMFGSKKTPEKRKAAAEPKGAKKGRKKLYVEEKMNSSTEENKRPVVEKKSGKKTVKGEEALNGDNDYNGYTAAMLEVVQKREKNKKGGKTVVSPVPSTSSGETGSKRTLRMHQPVTYCESPVMPKKLKRKKD